MRQTLAERSGKGAMQAIRGPRQEGQAGDPVRGVVSFQMHPSREVSSTMLFARGSSQGLALEWFGMTAPPQMAQTNNES